MLITKIQNFKYPIILITGGIVGYEGGKRVNKKKVLDTFERCTRIIPMPG